MDKSISVGKLEGDCLVLMFSILERSVSIELLPGYLNKFKFEAYAFKIIEYYLQKQK